MADFGEDMQARAQRLRSIVEEASTEVTSEDYAVKAVVGPGGAVRDIELNSRAFRYSATELGELIVDVLKQGRQQMERELTEQMAEIMGEDSGAASAGMFGSLPSVDELRRQQQDPRDQGGAS